MMLREMKVNKESCSKCGLCAAVCPTEAISHTKGEFPCQDEEKAHLCFQCAQCMAVCPQQAVTIEGILEDNLFELPKHTANYADVSNLMYTRRSIRKFSDKPVPRDVLEKIIDAASHAPMGFPPQKTHITVVQDRATLTRIVPPLVKLYENMMKGLQNPLIRFIIKCQVKKEDYATITQNLAPILLKHLPEVKKDGRDIITRNAPAVMFFHAERTAASHTADAYIAMTYAFLAAQSLGLGTMVSGLLPGGLSNSSEVRNILKIPHDHAVVSSMLIGYPHYQYKRGISRPFASVNWI